MLKGTESFDYTGVIWKNTLNTFTLETWLNHWKPLSEICTKSIEWSKIDSH